MTTNLFTIGFTRKSAEEFFTRLQKANVRRVLDIRLNNTNQLAGFSKRDDLRYFLVAIGGIEYEHLPELAPTQEILEGFKKKGGGWYRYEKAFLDLLKERRVHERIRREDLERACLLCSEPEPDRCHRRLVAEYLAARWPNLTIVHL
ncbi:MAG: DUF488 domain-containing protein [Deltaproteobacteria bacterium]|nr:DUF488 domain-containing protein [Deltaproteobacteria bacterium]MBW2042211.1 DUF488 domain-containing protein [Deltaproteobacteria bacterium]